jgi:hypothetical protein
LRAVLEVDNLLYEHALPEATQAYVSKVGIVTLDNAASRELNVCKYAHFVTATCAVVWGVWGSQTKDGGLVSLFQTAPAFDANELDEYFEDQLFPSSQGLEFPGQVVDVALVAMGIAASAEGLARKSKRGRMIGVGTALVGVMVGFVFLEVLLLVTEDGVLAFLEELGQNWRGER